MEDPLVALKNATTLYVGNLYVHASSVTCEGFHIADKAPSSFYTTEEQIHELFAKYALRRSNIKDTN